MRGCWVGASSGRGRCPGPTGRSTPSCLALSYGTGKRWSRTRAGRHPGPHCACPVPSVRRRGEPRQPRAAPPGERGLRRGGGPGRRPRRPRGRGQHLSSADVEVSPLFCTTRARSSHGAGKQGRRADLGVSTEPPKPRPCRGWARRGSLPVQARAEPLPPPLASPGTGHLLDSLPDGVDAVSVRGLWAVLTPSLAAWA